MSLFATPHPPHRVSRFGLLLGIVRLSAGPGGLWDEEILCNLALQVIPGWSIKMPTAYSWTEERQARFRFPGLGLEAGPREREKKPWGRNHANMTMMAGQLE